MVLGHKMSASETGSSTGREAARLDAVSVTPNLRKAGSRGGDVAMGRRNRSISAHVQGQMHNVQEFFAAYERFYTSPDAIGHSRFFAPTFMSASAKGVRVLTPAQLAAVGSTMRDTLDKLGRRGLMLIRLEEHPVDAHYVMATTEWQWRFEPEALAPFDVTLTATHILHRSEEGLRIVFYRSGDVLGALRERGLTASL
jgi:hypothetical protein